MKTLKFIEKARKVHGDKYDYSLVDYKNNSIKVKIICSKHGVFEQTPGSHLQNHGCPKCVGGKEKRNTIVKDFIKKAKLVHGDKYDYSLVKYKNSKTKVKIICPIHGEFEQTPNSHINNKQGCKKCIRDSDVNEFKNNFIEKAREVHGDKYDYSLIEYRDSHIKVKIICPIHGEFWQNTNNHLIGKGCPKCNGGIQLNTNEFIEKAREVHGDKYDYSLAEYTKSKDNITIICPIHGKFNQMPDKHINSKQGCPKCSYEQTKSKAEIELYDYIKSIYSGTIIQSDRYTISPLELDIYIPELSIAFEYNGLFWHSEHHKERNYHINKTNTCEQLDIQLVHIWEDDWLYNQDVVKNMIKAKMKLCKSKYYARKCDVIIPTKEQQKEFLNKHHIQGYGSGSIVYGLQRDLKLVAVMVFKNTKNAYILNRFASNNCIGAFGKLLKHFRKQHSDKPTISFGSRDVVFRNKNIYTLHNFEEVEIQNPDYMYIENNVRNHKFGYRKNILVKRFPGELNLEMTEKEMCKKLNIPRIYGCGLIKYKLV